MDAETIFGKLRQGGAQDASSVAGLADTYMAQNQYDRAMQALSDDLKRTPDSNVLRRLLASAATGAAKYDVALEQYSKLLAGEPGSAELYLRMAQVHQLKGDSAGVIGDLEKAKQLSPKDAFPVVALATFFQL